MPSSIKKGIIITVGLFCLFFFVPKARAAVVLDNLTGSTLDATDLHCQSSGNIANDISCIAWRQSFGYSTTTKPFLAKGKLTSITLNVFSDSGICTQAPDDVHLTIRVDDSNYGVHYGVSDMNKGEFLSFGHQFTRLKFSFSANDTVDFSTSTLKTLFTNEGNCVLIPAETGQDTILPSTYPDGNTLYKYCSIYGCVWGVPPPPPDIDHDMMMIIETTDAGPVPPPQPPGKTPVLIVPGILGTELWNGEDRIWVNLEKIFVDINDDFLVENLSLDSSGNSIKNIHPSSTIERISRIPKLNLNIFENLREDLEQVGYFLNQSLFYFPYDWRLDLQQTKDKLQQKIEAIKSKTGSPKVDIIAHSMGGLLAKSYLKDYGNDSVGKLIFVGTPHLGAPKAAKVLLEGDRFSIPWLDPHSMEQVASNSPAVYELLPDQQYFNDYQGYIKKYKFFGNPPLLGYASTTDFLLIDKHKNSTLFHNAETFKDSVDSTDFSGLDVYNIAGCKTATQAGYQLAMGNSIIGRVGYVSGDGTVPLPSSDSPSIPPLHRYYAKGADHASLPSANGVRELILDILNGQAPALAGNVSGSSGFCSFKGKTLSWHSPVEVHISSQGKHTGPIPNNGIEYGIPGVDYEVIGGGDGEKFIFLPTDEGQEYQITATGLEQGTFDLQIIDIDNGNPLHMRVFNDVPIATGTPISFNLSAISADNQIQVNSQPYLSGPELPGTLAEDLTPPEFTVSFSLDANDFVFWATDNFSGQLQPQCTASQCTASDPAGNTSKITFQKNKLLTLQSLSLKTIDQNHQSSKFPDNLLLINNVSPKGALKDFNQTVLIKKQEIGRVDYLKKRNLSNIIELTKQGIKRYSLPGVHYLELSTNQNNLATKVK